MSEISDSEYMWLVYALGAFLMFGVTNFLLKLASIKGVPSVEGTAVLWISTGLIGLIAILIILTSGSINPLTNPKLTNLDFKYFLIPAIAGASLAVGMYFLKMAVATGKAGPSTAIAASNAVLVTLLSWIALNEKLSISEVLGMFIYVIAIIFLSLKPLG
ncbi:MAG: EamA family transporter [Sulfolobales archaeon]|nr:EamA family transporter [Sulfolobales archaeon]MDW7969043.1 EamA family transporter [Sulfolobales archaeon]